MLGVKKAVLSFLDGVVLPLKHGFVDDFVEGEILQESQLLQVLLNFQAVVLDCPVFGARRREVIPLEDSVGNELLKVCLHVLRVVLIRDKRHGRLVFAVWGSQRHAAHVLGCDCRHYVETV